MTARFPISVVLSAFRIADRTASFINLDRFGPSPGRASSKEASMAKGQKRGNREHKKPKQPKPKVIAAAPSFTAALKPAAFASGRKK
jgi:hypothetical protein